MFHARAFLGDVLRLLRPCSPAGLPCFLKKHVSCLRSCLLLFLIAGLWETLCNVRFFIAALLAFAERCLPVTGEDAAKIFEALRSFS